MCLIITLNLKFIYDAGLVLNKDFQNKVFVESERLSVKLFELFTSIKMFLFVSLPDIKLSTVITERCLKCSRLLPIGQM